MSARELENENRVRPAAIPRWQCRRFVDDSHAEEELVGGRGHRRTTRSGGAHRRRARHVFRRIAQRSLSLDGERQGSRVAAVLEGTERSHPSDPRRAAGPGADTQAANPQWLDDGSGFFYNQLTGKVDTPERFLDSQARFHRLGTDPVKDPVLMKRGLIAGIDYDRIQAPYIVTYPGSSHAVLLLSDVRPEARAFIAPLADAIAGRARWTPVASFEDEG